MLRTNSKQVREKIRHYIIDNFTMPSDLGFEGIEDPAEDNFIEIAKVIYQVFLMEKYDNENMRRYYHYNEQAAFIDWCSGLPSIFNPAYYYRYSAVESLGNILEQTETEKNRFDEQAAEKLFTNLIYREIKKVVEV